MEKKEIFDLKTKAMEGRINGVLNYIQENPKSDPNAFEMNDICFGYADLLVEAKELGAVAEMDAVKEKFQAMMSYRMPQFLDPEQGLDCYSLYDYFSHSLEVIATSSSLGSEEEKQGLNSVCGVNLYVHQRMRNLGREQLDDVTIYDNSSEYLNLLTFLEKYFTTSSHKTDVEAVTNMVEEINQGYQATVANIKANKKEVHSSK